MAFVYKRHEHEKNLMCCQDIRPATILVFFYIPRVISDSFKTYVQHCPLYYSCGGTRPFHFTTVCSGLLQAIFCHPTGRKPKRDSAPSLVLNLHTTHCVRNSSHSQITSKRVTLQNQSIAHFEMLPN
jgi:hypothetical protein